MPLPVEAIASFPEWQQVTIILIAAIIVAHGLRLGIGAWISGSNSLAKTELDRVVLREINYPLYLSVILIGIYVILPVFGRPRFEFVVGGGLLTAVLVVWSRAGIRIGSQIANHFRQQRQNAELATVGRNLWSFFLLGGAFFILLSIWEIDITPFLASAGIVGIVLGIAAQDSIGNFIGGISLHLDQTFQLGDVIRLDDGTRGTVTSMSIRSTTILNRNNISVTIPNSELNRTKVENESAPQRRRRIQLDVGVGYGSDLEAVEEILFEVAEEEPLVLETPKPAVRFRAFEDSSIRAQLQVYIEHPALWGRARHALIRRISTAFAEGDIKIPFPQRELTFFEAENEIRIDNGSSEDQDTD